MTSKPAWQRLGLKLKSTSGNSGIGHPNTDTQPVDRQSTSNTATSPTKKRKIDDSSSSNAPVLSSALKSTTVTSASSVTDVAQNVSSAKKQRRGEDQTANAQTTNSTGSSLKKKKSVTFGETPTKNDRTDSFNAGHSQISSNKTQTPKPKSLKPPQLSKGTPVSPKGSQETHQQQQKKKGRKQQKLSDIKPALEYLRHWGLSRDSWKFNKNHQSTLIKHAFDTGDIAIPATDIDAFYQYIRNLQGQIRTRLMEMALAIRLKDQEDGVSGFPAGLKDAAGKQNRYEAIIAEYWSPSPPRKRKTFREADFLADSSSEDEHPIIQRVIKRLRAEMIIDELSDGEQTDASTTSTATTSSSSATIMNRASIVSGSLDMEANNRKSKMLKLNDGSAKRRRKLRTMNDSSDSDLSSDSESDSSSSGSSSSSSSSGSSSDEDDDDDSDSAVEITRRDGDGYGNSDSSSSSSSSSDEGGSDSESGSESDDEGDA